MINDYQMHNKRDKYIDQLLRDLKTLEERVITARVSDAVPFSFFNESFNKIQQIERLLHEMQLMQIDDMKHQMERLVKFLSETENKSQPISNIISETTATVEQDESPAVSENLKESTGEAPGHDEKKTADTIDDEPSLHEGNRFADGISLPSYKNPRIANDVISHPDTIYPLPEIEREEKQHVTTLNDAIQASPAVLDLKRGISLNDRFLFQRELFNNDRHEMNNLMITLNAFDNYDSADDYLRKSMQWNFDDPVVKDFLRVIKKGFE